MLIFLRWLLRLFKKEYAALSRYERSRPHFLWFLALDAILSIALVVGASQLLLGNSSKFEDSEPLEISAGSSNALINQAQTEKLDAFWLGPVTGDKYTLDDQESGIVDIFYWSGAFGNANPNAFLYEVKTYERLDVWNAHTHPIKANASTTTISINKNVTIKINRSSMKGVIASFKDKPEIVAIAYPKPQTLKAMIKNVESLKLAR